MASIIQELKQSFRDGNITIKLIYINAVVFILLNLILAIGLIMIKMDPNFKLDEALLYWVSVPTTFTDLIYRPWTLLTYMYVHVGLLHILSNMILLYIGGRFMVEFFGEKRLLSTYFMGGLAGAFLYIIAYNFAPGLYGHYGFLFGASASVMAIMLAVGVYAPEYVVNLVFIGPVRLKYIALFFIIMDIISIYWDNNVGGHIAHFGGAIYGGLFAMQYKKGKDWSRIFYGVTGAFQSLFLRPRKEKIKVVHRRPKSDEQYHTERVNDQTRLDTILDKISQSGYDSLSKEEKDFLFRSSQKK